MRLPGQFREGAGEACTDGKIMSAKLQRVTALHEKLFKALSIYRVCCILHSWCDCLLDHLSFYTLYGWTCVIYNEFCKRLNIWCSYVNNPMLILPHYKGDQIPLPAVSCSGSTMEEQAPHWHQGSRNLTQSVTDWKLTCSGISALSLSVSKIQCLKQNWMYLHDSCSFWAVSSWLKALSGWKHQLNKCNVINLIR